VGKAYHDVHVKPIGAGIDHTMSFRSQISEVRW